MRSKAPLGTSHVQRRMSPVNLAKHFACLAQVFKAYQINSACKIFNLDERRISTTASVRGRSKAAMNAKRWNFAVFTCSS